VLIHKVDIVMEFLLKTLYHHSTAVTIDIYRALGTVLYSNAGRTEKVSFRCFIRTIVGVKCFLQFTYKIRRIILIMSPI